jgi:LysM repeat protein
LARKSDNRTQVSGTGRGVAEEKGEEAATMPRYVTTPTRFLVIISTMLVALVLLLASSVMAAGPEPMTADYWVNSGDTLWSIAEQVAPEDTDVRAVVAEIRNLNDLESSLIYPGQSLLVPIASSNRSADL